MSVSPTVYGLNTISPVPSTLSAPFTLQAPRGVDLWRTPPTTDRFNAPFVYQKLPLSRFVGATVTATASWRALYDQAGLMLVVPCGSGSSSSSGKPGDRRPVWIKTGLEVDEGGRFASVVASNPYSDWSLAPVETPGGNNDSTMGTGTSSITVRFERTPANDTVAPNALWVYRLVEGRQRQSLREVTWFYDMPEDAEVWVGVFVAQPTGTESGEPLEVSFSNWSLDTK